MNKVMITLLAIFSATAVSVSLLVYWVQPKILYPGMMRPAPTQPPYPPARSLPQSDKGVLKCIED